MYPKLLEFIVAALLVVGAWFYAGHHAVEEYKEAQKIEQAEAEREQQKRYDKVVGELEELKTKRAENARTIIREVEKVVDRPVYHNNCIDTDGMQIINGALSGSGVVDAKVPAAE